MATAVAGPALAQPLSQRSRTEFVEGSGGGGGGQRTGGGVGGNSHCHTSSWADGTECSYSIGEEDERSRDDDGEDEGPGSSSVAMSTMLGFSAGFASVDAAGVAAEGVEDLEGRREDEGLDDGGEEGEEEEAEEEEFCCPVCLEDLTAFNHLHLATCSHILCGTAWVG